MTFLADSGKIDLMEETAAPSSSYGKRPLWQWIAIYVLIGVVVYGLIYYFVLAKKGNVYNQPKSSSQVAPSAAVVQQNTVTLAQDGYSPATITVKAGDRVIWVNKSGAAATVNSDPHPTHTNYPPLNLGTFPDGGSVSLTFDKPGTYGYHNHLNPGQKGTVIVQ